MESKTDAITWCSLFILEALLIVVVNAFSIVKFAETSKLLRRSSYLLINLAAADILVGALAIPLFIYGIGAEHDLWTIHPCKALWISIKVVDVISGLASILSLALVSAERLCATLWPFRHRTVDRKIYFIGIACVWLTACTVATIGLIVIFRSPSVQFLMFSSLSVVSACCVTICVANVIIWIRATKHHLPSQHRSKADQERRLTRTVVLVTMVSLCAWLPFTIMNLTNVFYRLEERLTFNLIGVTKFLHYGNSFVNFLIYSFRIHEFRTFFMGVFRCHSFAKNEDTVMLHFTSRPAKDTSALGMGILKSDLLVGSCRELPPSSMKSTTSPLI